MPDRLTGRTPCMADPTLFDQEIPGETPNESNARMARAAELCETACREFLACHALYPPVTGKHAGPSGVVAGAFRPRRNTRKTVACYGRYTEGDPCSGCGQPMVVDTEAEEVPEGFVLRFRASRCKSCHNDHYKQWKQRRRAMVP